MSLEAMARLQGPGTNRGKRGRRLGRGGPGDGSRVAIPESSPRDSGSTVEWRHLPGRFPDPPIQAWTGGAKVRMPEPRMTCGSKPESQRGTEGPASRGGLRSRRSRSEVVSRPAARAKSRRWKNAAWENAAPTTTGRSPRVSAQRTTAPAAQGPVPSCKGASAGRSSAGHETCGEADDRMAARRLDPSAGSDWGRRAREPEQQRWATEVSRREASGPSAIAPPGHTP